MALHRHLAVALGSAAGAGARQALTLAGFAIGVPAAHTLMAANIAGSLAIAAYTAWAARSPGRLAGPPWPGLAAAGFCGGFTTLSGVALAGAGAGAGAVGENMGYLLGQAVLWLAAAAVGYHLGGARRG